MSRADRTRLRLQLLRRLHPDLPALHAALRALGHPAGRRRGVARRLVDDGLRAGGPDRRSGRPGLAPRVAGAGPIAAGRRLRRLAARPGLRRLPGRLHAGGAKSALTSGAFQGMVYDHLKSAGREADYGRVIGRAKSASHVRHHAGLAGGGRRSEDRRLPARPRRERRRLRGGRSGDRDLSGDAPRTRPTPGRARLRHPARRPEGHRQRRAGADPGGVRGHCARLRRRDRRVLPDLREPRAAAAGRRADLHGADQRDAGVGGALRPPLRAAAAGGALRPLHADRRADGGGRGDPRAGRRWRCSAPSAASTRSSPPTSR